MSDFEKVVMLLLFMLSGLTAAFAQDFEPTDTWPYLYRDFQTGIIKMDVGGEDIKAAGMNISLDGKIHYINEKNQKVMAADMLHVTSVKIGEDTFLNVGGKMMLLMAENGNGTVVCETSLDSDEMSKSDIGYGISSSTASTQKLSSLVGDASSFLRLPLSTLMENRKEGEKLPVRQRLYIRVGLNVIPASKRGVSDSPVVDKDAAKAFFKTNKIKWNDPMSLLTVVDFISGQNK